MYNATHIDPPETTDRDDLIDVRVDEMAADPAYVYAWLMDAMDDAEMMRALVLMLSKKFDADSRADADALRLDLYDKLSVWCRAQVEAQAKAES